MFAIVAEIMNGKLMMTDPQKDVMTEQGNTLCLGINTQQFKDVKLNLEINLQYNYLMFYQK